MYTLDRNGDVFEIREESTGTGGPRARAASGPLPAAGSRASQVGYDQWKRFVETGQMRGRRLRGPVAASWKRCRELEVDPSPRSCWDFTPMEQLEPFASTYLELSRDIERKTYKAIKGKDLLITLADAQARVIRTCGDLTTLRQADKLNFGPGANWTEQSVGTNAIGTALTTGIPLQVFAEEHYCRSHHAWNCSAAPIFDPQGQVWGCFDISGPVSSDHSLAFDLVRGAARELERVLFSTYLAELENKSRSLLSAVFNSVLTGVLTVDAHGRIANANSAAAALLGRSGGELVGLRADAFFDLATYRAARRRDPSRTDPIDVACPANPNCLARIAPVVSVGGSCRHAVVTLTEPQRVRLATPPPAPRAEASDEAGRRAFAPILSSCPAMARAVQKARQAARTPSTVLITGESGTGKELFARGIHAASSRAAGPFVAVNCGALARELAQSELFGYRAGAFTGAADKGRIGKFEQADQGTLFLDEIGEMPLEMQVNLLRPLEERCVVRVGGLRCRPVDVKVIVATNRDLRALVADGRFREDLFFRINVVSIPVPPLRERGAEDVRLLAEHQAKRLCAAFGLPFVGFDAEAMRLLCAHDWPGNVRELLNSVEYAVNLMEDGLIRPEHLPARISGAGRPPVAAGRRAGFRLDNLEVDTIRQALEHHDGNISHAAKALGIGRNTLYAKMRKCGLR